MEKTINMGGRDVRMKITARIPFEYRDCFGKDLMGELNKLDNANGVADFSVFENMAWLLARKAGEEVHNDLPPKEAVGEWLDEFDDVLAVINAVPQIMELWNVANSTTSIQRKK